MGGIVAIILGVCGAAVLTAQVEPEPPSLTFVQERRFRASASPSIANGVFNCGRRDDLAKCLQQAGRDVCAAGEHFMVDRKPEYAQDGSPILNYRCVIREKPPVL